MEDGRGSSGREVIELLEVKSEERVDGGEPHRHPCLPIPTPSSPHHTSHHRPRASPLTSRGMSEGSAGSMATLTMGAAWNTMGARGRARGVLERVALLRMAASMPPMASTLPAGTLCVCGRCTAVLGDDGGAGGPR